jgi:peptide/nickel transport system ATP-binding protein
MQELLRGRALTVAARGDTARPLIQDVSLTLHAGEVVGIVGGSGSGKTTTAFALTGMLPSALCLQAGSAHYKTRDIYALRRQERAAFWGKETGFIFQDGAASLNPAQRIGTQIAERLTLFSKLSKSERDARVLRACKETGLPSARALLRKYPHELSGGMKQRVMIASAIIHAPALLIADEPTASLDAATAKEILALIKTLQEKRGCAVALISHDLNTVREMCSRVFVMHEGRIVESVPRGVFFAQPASRAARQLLRAARLFSDEDGGAGEREKLFRICASDEAAAQTPVIDAADLCASYESRFAFITRARVKKNAPGENPRVLKNISLSITEGEAFGILGKSGSGKTTLARALSGIIPYSGVYRADGREFSSLTQKERGRFVQMVFQNPYTSLNPAMTVQRILEEPLLIQHAGTRRDRAEMAREMLERVQLAPRFLTRFPRELSGGERQRLAIASALMLRPRLLIADEILSALDAAVQVKILELLGSLSGLFRFSVLFITHNAAHARAFCHRTAIMHDGVLSFF